MQIKQILESRSAPDENGCMNWLRGKTGRGYGAVFFESRLQRAHRVIWEYHNRTIPQGMLVCHQCDNPACCNPDHLFLGTQLDNNRDKVKKGRQPRGVDIPWTTLCENDIIQIRAKYSQGYRIKRLATEYGVAWETTRRIIIGRTWAHLPGAIEKTRNERIDNDVVRQIRILFTQGQKPKEIALELGESLSTVYHIATGRRRSNVK